MATASTALVFAAIMVFLNAPLLYFAYVGLRDGHSWELPDAANAG